MRNMYAGLVLWVVSYPLAIAQEGQVLIPEFRNCVIENGSWSACINALPHNSPLRDYVANNSPTNGENDSTGNHSYEYLSDQSSFPFLKGGIWSKTPAELFLEHRKMDRGSGYPSPSKSLM